MYLTIIALVRLSLTACYALNCKQHAAVINPHNAWRSVVVCLDIAMLIMNWKVAIAVSAANIVVLLVLAFPTFLFAWQSK